jgi:TolC family type I secretion outer membrane protein
MKIHIARPVCLRRSFISTVAAAVLMLGSSVAHAALTLEEALIATYQNNPQLQAERRALKATDENYNQAFSGYRPQMSLQGSYGRLYEDSDRTFSGARTNRTPRSYGVLLEQPLYRGGRTEADVARALNDVKQGRATLQRREQEILLQAVRAHVGVLRAQAVVRLNENNEEVLRRNLEATQDRFKVGEVTLTDVAQAESRLARAEADKIRAQGELTTAQATFQQVTGLDATALSDPTQAIELPATLDAALKVALAENPRVLAALYARKSAEKTVRIQQGFLLPELSLNARLNSSEDESVLGGNTNTAQATAQLTVPLYQSGAEYSRVREAKQLAAQQRALMLQEQRLVREDTVRSWDSLETAKAQIESIASEVRAGEIAVEGVKQEALVGSRTVLEVLDAEQELLDARVRLVSANADRTVAQYALLSVLGRLTAGGLALQTRIYNPAEHFEKIDHKWIGFGELLQQGNTKTMTVKQAVD